MCKKTWRYTSIYAAMFLGVSTPIYVDTQTVPENGVDSAAITVTAVSHSPSSPIVKDITFTAKTSAIANRVEFQFPGGSRQPMTSSNGGKDWTYYRSEGLVDANPRAFSVFVKAKAKAKAKAALPNVLNVSANPTQPTVGQPVTFTAKTDIAADRVEFQFFGGRVRARRHTL